MGGKGSRNKKVPPEAAQTIPFERIVAAGAPIQSGHGHVDQESKG
jgi:hypothetical protein